MQIVIPLNVPSPSLDGAILISAVNGKLFRLWTVSFHQQKYLKKFKDTLFVPFFFCIKNNDTGFNKMIGGML